MSTTEVKKPVESSTTNVHHVDVSQILAHLHGPDHAWINVGCTTFHFNDLAELQDFASRIQEAVGKADLV